MIGSPNKKQKPLTYQSSWKSLVDMSKFLSLTNFGDIDLESYPLSDYSSRNISFEVSCGSYALNNGEYGYFDDSNLTDDYDGYSVENKSCFEERVISNGKEDNKNIICALENGIAPIICRSFENLSSFGRILAHISLPGFRIVQDECGEVSEFKVLLTVNGKDYSAWRRFSDFRRLAVACIEFSKMERKYNSISFQNTINAWNEVLNNRPWFYQCLSINYLIEKSLLLENFMKNLFFEVCNVEILMEFVTDDD